MNEFMRALIRPSWWKVLVVVLIMVYPMFIHVLYSYFDYQGGLANAPFKFQIAFHFGSFYLLTWLIIAYPFKTILEAFGLWEIDGGLFAAPTLPLPAGMYVVAGVYAVLFWVLASNFQASRVKARPKRRR